MASKPTYGPEWATDHDIVAPGSDPSSNPVIAPTSAKRAAGFGKEPLPYQTINALLAEQGEWSTFLTSLVEPHASLHAYLTESGIAADPAQNGTIYPGIVRGAALPPGEELDNRGLGDLGAAASSMVAAADGRWIAVVTASDTVTVLNAATMSVELTISPSLGVSGSIGAIALDGFYLYMAYDGVVERYEIATGARDEDFGPDSNTGASFEARWIHDATINQLIQVGGSIFVVGAPAPTGFQNTPDGHNLVELDLNGDRITSRVALSGELNRASWGHGQLLVTSVAGDVGCFDSSLEEIWQADFSDWESVTDLAVGPDFVAIAGAVSSTTDISVRAYRKRFGREAKIGSFIGQVDFSGDAWIPRVIELDGDILVSANPDDGTVSSSSYVGCYAVKNPAAGSFMRVTTDANAISVGAAINVGSVTKTGTGVYTIAIPTELANQVGVGAIEAAYELALNSSTNDGMTSEVTYSSGVFTIRTFDDAGTPTDCGFSFSASWGAAELPLKWLVELATTNVIDLVTDGDAVFVATEEAEEFVRKLSLGHLLSVWMAGDRINDRVKGAARRIA